MPWTALATGGFIALFFVLGLAFPRVRPAFSARDTLTNLVTGGAMYGVRVLVLIGIAGPLAALEGGLIDLSALASPALQALVVFLLLDLSRYWVHRADHRVSWLWTFHRVHHSAEHLDATTGLRMHVVDILQLTAIPVVLFSVIFDISAFDPRVLPGVLMIGAAFDAFEHANLRVDISRPLPRAWNMVLNNPHFHSWHHTRDGVKKDGNYGQTLTIWDRLFGSCVTEPLPPAELGLEPAQALVIDPLSLQLLRRRGDP
ncbi:MAG: sterol desaturase family protein [Alphaproteobacteria bacterium]|nr:sterol desaturase family protein [Alphaproteobacteria bacterium]